MSQNSRRPPGYRRGPVRRVARSHLRDCYADGWAPGIDPGSALLPLGMAPERRPTFRRRGPPVPYPDGRPPQDGLGRAVEGEYLPPGLVPPAARLDYEKLTGPFDWRESTDFDPAMGRGYRIGDTVLVAPYAGFFYPPAYVDAVTIGGTAAFANQRRDPQILVTNGIPKRNWRWKITLRTDYVPGTSVQIPAGVATATPAGAPTPAGVTALTPTLYTPWASSPFFDANAVDRGRGITPVTAEVIDNGYRLQYIIQTAYENEGNADILPGWQIQASPDGNQGTGRYAVGPSGGPTARGLDSGIIRRVSVSVGDSVVIYAPGRSIRIFAYNPNINRIHTSNDGWYVPGIPLIASYSLDEGLTGLSVWNDMEEIEVPTGTLADLDIPPFCSHFEVISAPTLGTTQLYAASPGGEPSLYGTVLPTPSSGRIERVPGLRYYLTSAIGASVRVVVRYHCTG